MSDVEATSVLDEIVQNLDLFSSNDFKSGAITIYVPEAEKNISPLVKTRSSPDSSRSTLHDSCHSTLPSSSRSSLQDSARSSLHDSARSSVLDSARSSLHDSSQSSSSTRFNFYDAGVLQREVDHLKMELKAAHMTITSLQDREVKLKRRLAEQAQRMMERGGKFENISLGDKRPTAWIRSYGNLYAQARVDTLDALDVLLPLHNSDELKTKILFSVIVLAFRSVQNTISDIKLNVRSLLQVRDYSDDNPTLKELDSIIAVYLRKTVDKFNLTRNVNDVCAQIYATLYDYPCLKDCLGLVSYVRDCVRVAWSLSNQNPPYVIEYETRVFNKDLHLRFHSSDSNSDAIRNYMWPVLLEGEKGPCVHKGVVLT